MLLNLGQHPEVYFLTPNQATLDGKIKVKNVSFWRRRRCNALVIFCTDVTPSFRLFQRSRVSEQQREEIFAISSSGHGTREHFSIPMTDAPFLTGAYQSGLRLTARRRCIPAPPYEFSPRVCKLPSCSDSIT